ncbi:MAG: tRNA lysidine(34) synthetase TilS [Betaproteobacteria bacterium]
MNAPPATDPVHAAAAEALRGLVASQVAGAGTTRVCVALSGGRDSMVLLDTLARLAPGHGCTLTALHVHHGLSPHADAWAAFCAAECAGRGVALAVVRVHVDRTPGESLEAAARAIRYAALANADADVVALAHHADDQAETLLLQLLRGAGPRGLAAMATMRGGGTTPALIRPLLALRRADIEDCAAALAIRWIDDESNADTRLKRNYLRHEIAPRLAAAFPGYPGTLTRVAAHQAEAAGLLDDLAGLDARGTIVDDGGQGATLDRAALAALPPARARNLLRWFLRSHGLPAPSAARLAAMLCQLCGAGPDARVRLAHGGRELGLHRGRIVVHAPPIAPYAVQWRGEAALTLPHGVLEWVPARDAGIAAGALAAAPVVVRRRDGGERMRLAPDRPRQSLKGLLQRAAMPTWERAALPLVFCGDALAAVPGIGVDVAFQAGPGSHGYALRWRPSVPALASGTG